MAEAPVSPSGDTRRRRSVQQVCAADSADDQEHRVDLLAAIECVYNESTDFTVGLCAAIWWPSIKWHIKDADQCVIVVGRSITH